MKCTVKGCKNKATRHPVYGVMPCVKHKDEVYNFRKSPEFLSVAKKDRVDRQRDEHAKDILQPRVHGNKPNPEFAKAYPDLAPNYFTPEEMKKL